MFNADPTQGARLKRLLPLASDMHRFALSHWTIIEEAPLQLYSSALIFSPASSLTRKLFASKEPDWIVQKPRVEQSWNSCLARLVGRSGTVSSVAFSPDDHHIVAGSFNGAIQIWDAETAVETLTLHGHTKRVWSVTFDEDCKFITSKSDDQTIKVWDAETGACISTCESSIESTEEAIFSPDNRRCTPRYSFDGILHITDNESGTEVLTLRGHSGPVKAVAFSPDGRYIASGSDDSTAMIWDAVTGNEVSTLQGKDFPITSVCFSPDARHLATGSKDGTIRIWDVENSAGTSTLHGRYGHRNRVNSVALSLDGRRIAAGSDDRTVQIWDTENGDNLQTLEYDWRIKCVTFSPDGSRIAALTGVDKIVISDSESGVTISTCDASFYLRPIFQLALSLNGYYFAIGTGEKAVIQDSENVNSYLRLRGHRSEIISLSFSPKDCYIVVSVSTDTTVKIWNIKTNAEIATLNLGTKLSFTRFDSTGAVLHLACHWDSTRPQNSNSVQTGFVLPEMRQMAYCVRGSSKQPWITWHSQDILQLPADFQPTYEHPLSRSWDGIPGMIAIGGPSGRVFWLKFSPEHHPCAYENKALPMTMREIWNDIYYRGMVYL